jgi:hypothetical protein
MFFELKQRQIYSLSDEHTRGKIHGGQMQEGFGGKNKGSRQE